MMSAFALSTSAARHARHLTPLSLRFRASTSNIFSATASPLSTSVLSSTYIVETSVQASGAYNAHYTNKSTSILTVAAVTSLAAAFSISLLDNNHASCETTTGPADEMEENDDVLVVSDGMDADSGTSSAVSSTDVGPAEAEEDYEDDPSNDEETTCSICLINRQGPCRKVWLKFEYCMKEHSAEKDKARSMTQSVGEDKEANKEASDNDAKLKEQDRIENEWDEFMEKSTQPGEDDDEDSDGDESSEEDDDEDNENGENEGDEKEMSEKIEDMTLAEKCDKFMIPWIGCIQEHRNIYSLISNDFYQKDYVDPLEDAVPESRRKQFSIEVDLENWIEHVEADEDVESEGDDEDTPIAALTIADEPHLINAYAKFQLTDPNSGEPIEVAYIKDQKGRLLGFDSFSKNKSSDNENGDNENSNDSDEKIDESNEGECTFHLVPGETTIITAYAIYRGRRIGDEGESVREDTLYYTTEIPLPGQNRN